MRRTTRLLAGLVIVLAGATVGPGPATGAAVPRDTVTVGGYDDPTDLPSDVVAGTADDNLVFTYTAASALTDGTIQVDLPAADWATRVRAVVWFDGSRSEQGFFGPRPHANGDEPTPAGYCDVGWHPADDPGQPPTWSAYNTATTRSLVVTHVTCAPGDRLLLKLRSVRAPATAGRYRFGVSVSDAAGVRRVRAPVLRVRPTPRTHLEITTDDVITLGEPTDVLIRALRPDGRVDTSFSGLVAIHSEDRADCTFEGYEAQRYPISAGVLVLPVELQVPFHRISVRDVAARAVPGLSDRFATVGDVTAVDCPVAFH